jgi:hypothetical protein
MRFVVLLSLIAMASCVSRPSLEELEDDAGQTGDWAAVERREELVKERLESTAPRCPDGLSKDCVEEPSGIACYCRPPADQDSFD